MAISHGLLYILLIASTIVYCYLPYLPWYKVEHIYQYHNKKLLVQYYLASAENVEIPGGDAEPYSGEFAWLYTITYILVVLGIIAHVLALAVYLIWLPKLGTVIGMRYAVIVFID